VRPVSLSVSRPFRVTNTGNQAGSEIAEVYAALPKSAGEPPKRLVGWSKVKLDVGGSSQSLPLKESATLK
jgi:hypothetical protein